MRPLTSVPQVFDAIQQAKQGASAFCTNFFPVQSRLQAWIDHGELFGETRPEATLFLRRDRGFSHFYFCAASLAALERELAAVPELRTEPVAVDLVGTAAAVQPSLSVLERAGFRRYRRLQRLARVAGASSEGAASSEPPVILACATDCQAVLELLAGSFDAYADQLPTRYELEAAIASRQIYAIKKDGALGAALFFETQGLTSVLRYWVVAPQFRAHRFGAALIRHYFGEQRAVRRFILWVTVDNENALEKYRHYGYAPDGLVDHVLLNDLIRP